MRPPQLASDRATPKDGIAGGTQQNDHVRAVPNARAAGKVYLLRQWLRHFALAFWAVHRSLLLQHRFYLGATADTDRGDVTDVTDVTANTGMGEGANGRTCKRCPQPLSVIAVDDLCGRCKAKRTNGQRPVFALCCDDDANAPAELPRGDGVSGGATPALKGNRFEVAVVQDQRRLGRLAFRLRQGQGCAFDVLAIERCADADCTVYGRHVSHALLIQCRNRADGRTGIPAAEAAVMAREAADAGATALVATPDAGAIVYGELAW